MPGSRCARRRSFGSRRFEKGTTVTFRVKLRESARQFEFFRSLFGPRGWLLACYRADRPVGSVLFARSQARHRYQLATER